MSLRRLVLAGLIGVAAILVLYALLFGLYMLMVKLDLSQKTGSGIVGLVFWLLPAVLSALGAGAAFQSFVRRRS